MLNKDSVVVLRKLKKINFNYDNIDEFCKLVPNMSKSDVEGALWYLDKKGYLICSPGDNTVYSLAPTYEGEHYFQFKWAEFKSFMLRSVITPILTAFFTTLLTLLISAA